MYFLLGICLVFAFLLTLNLFASVSASILWRAISKPARSLSSRKQEQIIFALRVFPVGGALIFVLAFLTPAYLLFEPASSGEVVSLKLALISLACLFGITIAVTRVVRTWLVTNRLIANWLKHSEPFSVDNVDIPVYRINHPFPLIAVVGMLRPRLFVASQVLDLLSPNEFRAAIAHEYGHLTAHDNFKRAFLRLCRDMLIFPVGRGLDRAWAENTETAADEYAAKFGGDGMALDLAQALIKIARMIPQNARPVMPLASFLIGDEDGNLRGRIERLLKLSENQTASAATPWRSAGRSIWLYMGVVSCGVLFLATNKSLLLAIHNVAENVVAILE